MEASLRSAPFSMALSMAKKSEQNPYKVGACLARGPRIISAGFNQIKTHPFTLRLRNSMITCLHAEMHACLGVDSDALKGASIYVVRLRRDGTLSIAKPCRACTELLSKLGVKKAYYTDVGGGVSVTKIKKF